jgi:hypothetical protein
LKLQAENLDTKLFEVFKNIEVENSQPLLQIIRVKDKFSINKIQNLEQQSLKNLVFTLEKE